MTQLISVLSQLRELKLDDSEVIAAVMSAENANYTQTGKRDYEIRSTDHLVALVKFNSNHKLCSVAIPNDVWVRIREKIMADAAREQTRIARTTLFTYRPLNGFTRVPGWLQLRPVACELKDSTGLGLLNLNISAGIPRPFVIEVAYRYSNLPFLEVHRRIFAVQEAIWLLSAFIDIPVFILRNPFSWALLGNTCQLVRCGMPDGLEESSDLEFSNTQGLVPLTPTPTEQYFRELGITSSNFRVPDLGNLYSKYKALPHNKQLCFLRSCASLSAASNPTIEISQKVVSLVSAIEPFLDAPEKCIACREPRGITKQFKKFLDTYVQPSPEVKALYEGVYSARSRLVHGGWNFDVDEPILGIRPQAHDVPLAAWDATKRGIMKWLLAQ
jgi:hypothetical protein